jgi:hypothetical protein
MKKAYYIACWIPFGELLKSELSTVHKIEPDPLLYYRRLAKTHHNSSSGERDHHGNHGTSSLFGSDLSYVEGTSLQKDPECIIHNVIIILFNIIGVTLIWSS